MWLDGINDWYSPSQVWNIFLIQDWWSQTLLVLNSVAGISLFIRRKTSWMLAVALLIYFSIENVFTAFETEHWLFKGILPLAINSSFLIVFYYFRFPYLDRRDQPLRGMSNRHDLLIPVRVDGQKCTIHNISATGCYLAFPNGRSLPPVNSKIQLEMEGLSIEGSVRRHENNFCAIQFKGRFPRSMIKKFRKQTAA